MEDCLCGENYQNSKCRSCNVIYCKKFTDNCKFGKNVNEKGISLCRLKSLLCLECKKYSCNNHWKQCDCCNYFGPVQCELCRINCEECNADLHLSCVKYCGDCKKKICTKCSGRTYCDFDPCGGLMYWCKECSKKYPDDIEENIDN